MSLTSGTPIWASLVLSFGATASTHYLTLWREANKRGQDVLSNWKSRALGLLENISDGAVTHYTDPSAIAVTQVSAQRLLTQLRRLGAVMREVVCVDPANTRRMTELLTELHIAVTDSDDFQNDGRTIRAADDPLIGKILECEQQLRSNIGLPRKQKPTAER